MEQLLNAEDEYELPGIVSSHVHVLLDTNCSALLAEMQAESAQDKQTIAQLQQQLAAMMQQMQQMKQHMQQQQMTTTTTATATNDQQIHDTTSTQANTSATTETPSATMHD